MQYYKKTVLINDIAQLQYTKPGQWVQFDSGTRGQYLGTTDHGTVIIRYQNGKFGLSKDTNGNYLLRRYALENGSK